MGSFHITIYIGTVCYRLSSDSLFETIQAARNLLPNATFAVYNGNVTCGTYSALEGRYTSHDKN